MGRRVPEVDVSRFDNRQGCTGNGGTCYGCARLSNNTCYACGFYPSVGIAFSAGGLCCPCMHERVPDVCQCAKSLYWLAEQGEARSEFLRLRANRSAPQQMQPPPAPVPPPPTAQVHSTAPRQAPPQPGNSSGVASPAHSSCAHEAQGQWPRPNADTKAPLPYSQPSFESQNMAQTSERHVLGFKGPLALR